MFGMDLSQLLREVNVFLPSLKEMKSKEEKQIAYLQFVIKITCDGPK